MRKIPFVVVEKPAVGKWNTPELKRQYYFDENLKKTWWYDFIPCLRDDEFTYLKSQFDKLDKDHSRFIELNELKNIEIYRKRFLDKAAMAVLQPEFEKFLQRLDPNQEIDVIYKRISTKVTGFFQDSPLRMNAETCHDMMQAFSSDKYKGKMSLYEYLGMMQYIQLSICLFQIYDDAGDGNNALDENELVKVMAYFGYNIDKSDGKKIVEKMGRRFIFAKYINRTEFVAICGLIASLRTSFQKNYCDGSKFAFDGVLFSNYFMSFF